VTNNSSLRTVVLAAGGTAGHVFPALSIYQALVDDGVKVHLFTDERGTRYASDFAPEDVQVFPSGGLVSGSIRKRLTNLGRLASGLRLSRSALKRLQPDAVIGMGGYAAVGPLVAARQLGIRNVLHEQNSVMGLANKATAPGADAVALSFDPTEGARGTTTVTGNPSRSAVVRIGEQPFRPPTADETFNILVMGGSQGARSISDNVPSACAALSDDRRLRLHVTHQGRVEDHARVAQAYTDAGVSHQVESFVDVPAELSRAHLFIGRSGASTVCDVAVARRPAIYLPLLTHADLQQLKNANAVAVQDGALIHREDEAGPLELGAAMTRLMDDGTQLQRMADASRRWSRPDAVAAILHLVYEPT